MLSRYWGWIPKSATCNSNIEAESLTCNKHSFFRYRTQYRKILNLQHSSESKTGKSKLICHITSTREHNYDCLNNWLFKLYNWFKFELTSWWMKKGYILVYSTSSIYNIHCKKGLSIFPSPAGMSLTKLSLVGNDLIIPFQGEFG